MTAAQTKALRVLGDGQGHPTARTTRRTPGRTAVGGVTANALIRRGFARVERDTQYPDTWVVIITDEGRRALQALPRGP